MKYKAIVIGVSAGGLHALGRILPNLEYGFSIPIIIVQHLSPDSDGFLAEHFDKQCKQKVVEVIDKLRISKSHIYFAPPNYHLLIEDEKTFALSVDERVNFSRPSIDVLFESAADVFGSALIGMVLTGANYDGSKGLLKIKKAGGFTIAQDPKTAEVDTMPRKAIELVDVDKILPLEEIAPYLNGLFKNN